MYYLFLAIASSAMVSVTMRLSTGKVTGSVSMLAVNYAMCLLLSGGYTVSGGLFPALPGLPAVLGMGVIHGALYLFSFVLFQFNVRENGVVLSATFMKLGLLVPMVLSIFWFGEVPAGLQIIGFCIAVAAIILINLENGIRPSRFRAGLILLLLGGGAGDAMAKVFEELGPPALASHFLFYTFLAALLLCLVLMVRKKERPGRGEICYGILVGIPNFFSARFLIKALEYVDAVIVYPTYSAATLFVVTVVGVLVFGERLERRQWIAMGAILAALVLLNL